VRGGDQTATVTLHFTHKWSVFGPVSGTKEIAPAGQGH